MRRLTLRLMAAALMAMWTVAASAQTGAGSATVGTASGPEYGTYLVDGKGMSLYLFEPDQQGKSTCYNACANAWPPLLTDASPIATGDVDRSLLDTTERRDGSEQVTYNGWPLYYFVKDDEPGDTTGQDVKGFGGEWYLVGVGGEHVED